MARGSTLARKARELAEHPAVQARERALAKREAQRNSDKYDALLVDAVDIEAALASPTRNAQPRVTNDQGYVLLWMPLHSKARGGRVLEHRVVMERKLGRFLEAGENVHHINGVRDDNHPENLELWVRPQPTGIRVEDAVVEALETLRKYAPHLLAGGK